MSKQTIKSIRYIPPDIENDTPEKWEEVREHVQRDVKLFTKEKLLKEKQQLLDSIADIESRLANYDTVKAEYELQIKEI